MIIQQGMTINVRTKEELDIVIEVCEREGHQRTHRATMYRTLLELRRKDLPISISCGACGDVFPKDISIGLTAKYMFGKKVIEASELFHNQLISKRRNLH